MIFATKLPLVLLIAMEVFLLAFTVFCCTKKQLRKARFFRRIGIIALLILAIMRPAVGTVEVERELGNLNIYFVVDNTGSMVVRDMDNGSKYRFEKVAEDMKKIVELFPGSKYSIITMDYSIYQAMPLVSSANTVNSYVGALKPKNNELTTDSDLSDLLSYSADRIEKYTKRFPDRSNLLFLFTDGEDSSKTTAVPDKLASLVNGGAIIGYGTTTGGEIHRVSYNNEITNEVIKDKATNSAHISKLDETNLKAIADKLALSYYRRSSSSDKFSNTSNFFNASNSFKRDGNTTKVSNEFYWIPMLGAIALLLWDFSKILDNLLLERKAAK